jgi:hypothetical protein
MSMNDADAQLSQKIDLLVKTWGLAADCSGDSLSKNDVLRSCSIGDIAAVSKLKSRPMQAYVDSTSALGLRIVGTLAALLQHQVTAPSPTLRCPISPSPLISPVAIFKRSFGIRRTSQESGRRRWA